MTPGSVTVNHLQCPNLVTLTRIRPSTTPSTNSTSPVQGRQENGRGPRQVKSMQYMQAAKNCRESSFIRLLSSRMLVTQAANYDRPISVLLKDPNAHSALSQSELVPGTSASEYLFQTMVGVRKLCRAPHRGLSVPQMLDSRQKSVTRCHYSRQSRAHVLLQSTSQNFVYALPRMFLSNMHLVSSY
jgi:hypothetical protein